MVSLCCIYKFLFYFVITVKTCLNETLNNPESCLKQYLTKVKPGLKRNLNKPDIFDNIIKIPVHSEKKCSSQGCAVYTGFTLPGNFSNNHLTFVFAYLIFFYQACIICIHCYPSYHYFLGNRLLI
jgi:hypothetical protein